MLKTALAAQSGTASLAERTLVAVVGAGTMGRGIAQLAAQAGHRVLLYDVEEAALTRARAQLEQDLAKLEARGKLAESADAVLGRLECVRELTRLRGARWVIEAAPEDLELKRALLRDLAAAAPEAVLASNTSTFAISALAGALEQPERLLGLHFFNPAPVMKLVEVVAGDSTPADTIEAAVALAESLGKTPAVVRDAPGFLVNRVARPFYGEALKLHGEGLAAHDIDRVMRGLGFRMGPFELMDLIGLDVNLAAATSVYEAFFHEPRYRPSPIQKRMVEAGALGQKSGRGFYSYPRPDTDEPAPPGFETPPKTYLVGDNALAAALRARFVFCEDAKSAALVVDARVLPGALDLPRELPVATVVWGRSVSLALRDCRRNGHEGSIAGFSLVPPLLDASVAELYTPLSGGPAGGNTASQLAARFFAAQDVPILHFPDTPGGVGFRILAMLVGEAVSALAEGVADAASIDNAMKLGTNYPLGPLEWSERLGLDQVLAALEGLFAELGEDRYRPHPLLRRMVAAGLTSWRQI